MRLPFKTRRGLADEREAGISWWPGPLAQDLRHDLLTTISGSTLPGYGDPDLLDLKPATVSELQAGATRPLERTTSDDRATRSFSLMPTGPRS